MTALEKGSLGGRDYGDVSAKIQAFIASKVDSAKAKGAVLGLSGGLDSSVVAYLAVQSLTPERVLGLILPDSRITHASDVKDAKLIAKLVGIRTHLHDIAPIHRSYVVMLPRQRLAEGNLRARIRMSILYYYANLENRLVLGTGDKSEIYIGYFTKFGDGGVDVEPIGDLYKTEVRELGRYLGVPERVLSKKSSPRLWRGHKAEEEIGVSYDMVDKVLYYALDLKMSLGRVCSETSLSKSQVERVLGMWEQSRHKRIAPETYYIS